MMALFTRQQITLAGLCLVLVLLLAYEWSATSAAADVPPVLWHSRNAAASLVLAPQFPSSSSFAATDARPLFNPARKAVEVPAVKPETAAVPPPNDVALIGVIIDGERRLALLHTPQSPLAISAVTGQSIGGWTVKAIEPDHIVLNSGNNDYTLNMNAKRSAGPADAMAAASGTINQPVPIDNNDKPADESKNP